MKWYKFLGMSLFMAALSLSFAACSSDDDDDDLGGEVDVTLPADDNRQPLLNEWEQKEKIDEIGREFLGYISASDFQDLTDLSQYVEREYGNSDYFEDDEVEDWFEAAMMACEQPASGNYVKRLIVASNFTGEFTAGRYGWEKTGNGSSLVFNFTDGSNRNCRLTVTPSGGYTAVHHEAFDESDYDWSYRNGRYYEEKILEAENTIGVPETITASLTQGGTTLASATVKTAISGVSGDVTLNSGVYAASVDATLCGYSVKVTDTKFDPQNNAGTRVVVSKNGTTLITATATANGRLRQSGDDVTFTSGGEASLRVDILNKMSIRGTVKNLKTFVNALEDADKYYDEEARFKSYLEEANEQLDLGVYYDGGNTRQANVKLMADVHSYGWYYTYYEWKAVPGIEFTDGTSYLLEDFFDDNTFKSLTRMLERLADDFDDLVDDDDNSYYWY